MGESGEMCELLHTSLCGECGRALLSYRHGLSPMINESQHLLTAGAFFLIGPEQRDVWRIAPARCSGDLLPPSPPAEKATASQDETGGWGQGRVSNAMPKEKAC